MSFPIIDLESGKSFPGASLQKPVQESSFSQNILCDLSESTDDENTELPAASTSETALIYGGVTSSVQSVSQPLDTRQVASDDKQDTKSFPSPASNWSTSVETLLDQPPSTLPKRLVMGGIVFCLAFGAWATFGRIDEVGHAQGRLVPQGEAYKVDPEEMGKVANIAVKEGQLVKAGEVLVELDTQMATGEVDRLQKLLSAYETELRQKQTLLQRSHLEARTRSQIAEADAQSQKAAIAQANAKTSALTQLLAQHQAMVAADREKLERLKPLAATAQELIKQRQSDVAAQQERVERLKPLLADGAISKELVFQAEQSLRDRKSAITQSQLTESANTKEQLFQAQQSLRDRQNTITQSQGELQQTLAQAAQLQAGLAQKQAEGRKTQIEAQQQIQQLEVEITQLKAKIADTQNLLTSAKAKLKQRFLYAPVAGVVSSLNVRNIGQVVQPGETVAEIAPKNAPLVLTASLPNREAGFVKIGMPVQVKLDAYPYQDYGVVSGKVTSISPDAKPDQQLGSVYRIKVELERNYVTANNRTIQFKAGQTGNADIIIRRRRIADILLEPIKQLQKGGLNL